MDLPEQNDGLQPLVKRPTSVSVAFEGSAEIAEARDLAQSFLADLQAVHGMTVSARVKGMVQLVVSELVANARKCAPGPCLLTLEAADGAVDVTVWDSEPRLPVAQANRPEQGESARVGNRDQQVG